MTEIIEVPITDMAALAQQVIECEKSAQRNREFLFSHVVDLDGLIEHRINHLREDIRKQYEQLFLILAVNSFAVVAMSVVHLM